MLYFTSDYQEGAHPSILQRLEKTNLVKTAGYGTDEICESARDRIRDACQCKTAGVYFLSGGTQANEIVITSLLCQWQGVIAADTGHIASHEAGAIEAGGHKVMTLPHSFGKITAQQIDTLCNVWEEDANHDHMVMPGMVYLSQPTEYGTLYSLRELTQIREVCDRHDLKLYIDGARLAYALASKANTVMLPDLAQLCDVFYIGGTKCGALLGEAVVVPDPSVLPHFFTIIKQRGALLAKGRVLGIQFDELFRDGLYMEIGKDAVAMAGRIQEAFRRAGYTIAFDSPTNQVFVIFEDQEMKRLSEEVTFSFWEKTDETHTTVRLATSWATSEEDIQALEALLSGPVS